MEDKIVILVVEDDPQIQTIIDDALSEGGFEAAIVASGEEAITLLKGGGLYRALILDIGLRGRMVGWDVARQARAMNEALPVVYITAADGDKWSSEGVPNSVLLAKPFAPAQLITAISNLLNVGSAPA